MRALLEQTWCNPFGKTGFGKEKMKIPLRKVLLVTQRHVVESMA